MDTIKNWYSENVSDISFTNKDFRAIYTELLDLVKKLTNKWDPSLSNESDPGVILLKLNALIADKNNYNIDKNILECFPASVTQEGNARKLYDSLGYRMHWYKSATTNVGFRLKNSNAVEDFHTIENFTYINDSSGEVVYSTLKPVTLYANDTSTVVYTPVIEGKVVDYEINGNTLITLNNLDNDLRLYFNDTMVAENGIFIRTTKDTSPTEAFIVDTVEGWEPNWKRVDNLASYPLNKKVYEFGVLPNSNTCYIQFPKDIASLIEGGLYIKYTISNGLNGNIKKNVLTTFMSDETTGSGDDAVVINDQISIIQSTPATNGDDPETIKDAYNNYKRVIGTFNTLVTRKDYENYLYSNSDMCSNLVVADRTNDLNYSNFIQTWTSNGSVKELSVTDLTAYNIVFYMLTPVSSIHDVDSYNNSYKPNNVVGKSDIEAFIDDVKSSQHDIIIPGAGWEFYFTNSYVLKGSLLTYRKVTADEAADIELNVREALMKAYNANNVVFGESLDYNDLIDLIISADDRIRSVVFNSTYYTPEQIYGNGSSVPMTTTMDDVSLNSKLVARMILSGHSQLFKFDTDFEYEFGQDNSTKVSSSSGEDIIKEISSEVIIDVPDESTDGYQLKENEVIHVYSPALLTDVEYSTFVKYWFESPTLTTIKSNVDYQLKDGEILYLRYTDTSNALKDVQLQAGTIIESNVIINGADSSVTPRYGSLSTGEYIRVKKINSTKLGIGTKYCFITNNMDNSLSISSDTPKVLQENEYFLYTNDAADELILLGSGTMISVPNGYSFNKTIKTVNVDDITEGNLDNIDWEVLGSYNDMYATSGGSIADSYLEITDLNINTYGFGTYIKSTNGIADVSNKPQPIASDNIFMYKTTSLESWKTLKPLPNDGLYWSIQSRLNINAVIGKPQLIQSNQSIKLTLLDNTEVVIDDEDNYLEFNSSVVLSGGENIDAKVLLADSLKYTLKARTYSKIDVSKDFNRVNGIITINGSKSKSYSLPYTFTDEDKYHCYLVPVYIHTMTSGAKISFSNAKIYDPSTDSMTAAINLESPNGRSLILMLNNTSSLDVVFNSAATTVDYVTIGKIVKLDGLNNEELDDDSSSVGFKIDSKTVVEVLKVIKSIDTENKFNWTYEVPDINKVTQPTKPESYWNTNHIYNAYTLPKIDFDKYSITVSSTSVS